MKKVFFRQLFSKVFNRGRKTKEEKREEPIPESEPELELNFEASPNPFDQLGLHKRTIEYLHNSGQLEHFLVDYHQRVQSYVLPNQDNAELLGRLNESFERISSHPSQREYWVKSMGLQHREYLEVIAGLTAEIEKLQKVEKEYQEMQAKAAQKIVKELNTGDPYKELIGSPPPTTSRTTMGFSPSKIHKRTPRERKIMVREFLAHRHLDTDFEVIHRCAEDEPYERASRGECVLFYSTEPIRNGGTFKEVFDFEGEFLVPKSRVYELRELIVNSANPKIIVERLGLEETFEKEVAAYVT